MNLWVFLWCFGLAVSNESIVERITYHNHKLYLVDLGENLNLVNNLNELSKDVEIDFWNTPVLGTKKISFRVSPPYQSQVELYLNTWKNSTSLKYTVLTHDLQEWIDQERLENNGSDADNSDLTGRDDLSGFKFNFYHPIEEINGFLDKIATENSEIAKNFILGTTYENHKIRGVKLGIPSNNTKSAIWIDAGIHAREWVSPATAIFIINELYSKHNTDPEIQRLMENYDWYITPVLNPDGYMYTWWTNRLWRKNRATPKAIPLRSPWNLFDSCIGTDLNRNFDIDFGGAGTSGNPCSEQFRGDYAFSEKETQAVREGIQALGTNLKVFISLHAYSQMWMMPYGYTFKTSPHHNELLGTLTKAVLAVQKKHGLTYKYGSISTTIYPASGSSCDWAHEKGGIKHSYTVELRDLGTNGFLLPRQQIIPTAEENWEGVKVIANDALN